jgi:hypothetical protein
MVDNPFEDYNILLVISFPAWPDHQPTKEIISVVISR